MVAKLLPSGPKIPLPLTFGVGSRGQNSTVSEHGYVAYQIKGNLKIVLVILTPCPLGWGQKVKVPLFQNMVMLHMK